MLDKVRKTILRYRMIAPGDVVIVATSGGPDSMCLLDMLERLGAELSFELEVAHYEHGIRGENSRLDAQFVQKAATSRGLKLTVEAGDVPSQAALRKMSVEEAARESRYAFFERILDKYGDNTKIALGHTATDQAETVLMRLLRGAGIRGLSAISPVRGPYIRPLIDIEREDVVNYLEMRSLSWCEDETNLAMDALRNRIRHELMPVLERNFNPRLVEALSRTADVCRLAVDYLDKIAEKIVRENVVRRDKGFFLEREVFAAEHPAIAAAVFEALWRMARGNLRKLRYEHRMHILEASSEGRSGIFCLPDDWIAAVDSGGLLLSPEPPGKPPEYELPLEIPGETRIRATGAIITAEIIERNSILESWKSAAPEDAYLDLDAIKAPLVVRSLKPGDRMEPLGGAGTRKLQDIFTDLKAPRWMRAMVPVIAAGDEIVWVAPLKIAHTFRVTEKTATVLHLQLSGSVHIP